MGYETEVVHPAAAKWLTKHGYTYQHEVRVEVGRVDFLATHSDGHKLIVECKSDGDDYRAALRQIFDYAYHMGSDYRAALALPTFAVTNPVHKACAIRGVTLIALDVEPREPDPYRHRVGLSDKEIRRLAFYDDVWQRPKHHIEAITGFHQNDRTLILRDLYQLLDLIRAAMSARNSVSRDHFDDYVLVDITPVEQLFDPILKAIEDDYRTLQEYVDRAPDAAECRGVEYNQRAAHYLARYGVVPLDAQIWLRWEAEKATEFYCMTDMIHHFDMNDDGVFFDGDGGEVSDSLVWEGSANSFEDAQSWYEYRAKRFVSYFSQFEFLNQKD